MSSESDSTLKKYDFNIFANDREIERMILSYFNKTKVGGLYFLE
jgi:hypothetical protein